MTKKYDKGDILWYNGTKVKVIRIDGSNFNGQTYYRVKPLKAHKYANGKSVRVDYLEFA